MPPPTASTATASDAAPAAHSPARVETGGPRRGLLRGAGWMLAGLGLLVDSAFVILHLTQRAWDADFRIFYSAAKVAREAGWNHLYDAPALRAQESLVGPPPLWQYLNPPPLAWLAAPFTLLPYPIAFVLWSVLLVGVLAAAFLLALPALRSSQVGWALAATAWAFPVLFGVTEGQPTPILALGVVACWRLARWRRDVLAGAALGLTLFKPHTAWLVPVVFLVAWRPRVLLGYAAVGLPLAAASALSLGPSGLAEWLTALTATRAGVPAPLFIFPGFLPAPYALLGEGLALVATAIVVLRARSAATEARLIAIGVVGSLLVAPYLNIQDLTLLVVAGWLLWPEVARRREKVLLGGVYATLLITPGTSIFVIPAQAAWLLATGAGEPSPKPRTPVA